MKKANVLLLLITWASMSWAQKAPNFSILDYNNETHNLYDDYLDKGKVVMLKIMFVACPPCNLSAPGIQDLYEEFGEGMEDVQFIELSNKNWDDNDAMKGFGEKHGLTFPGAGADGGALAAVAPYTSGTFGTFTGTPTFIVIDSDGNVNFRIPQQNLKKAIEEALDAGSGGCANRFGGKVDADSAETKIFLESDITGATVYELEVDDQFEYQYNCEFTFPPQSFEYYATAKADGDDLNGVTLRDILFILRHLLALDMIDNSKQKIAADYTANGVISVRDISEIRKLILGNHVENPHHDSWLFYHESTDFTHDSSGILIPPLVTQVALMDLVDSTATGNWVGIKLGDVSGEINTFFNKKSTRSAPQPIAMVIAHEIHENEGVTSHLTFDKDLLSGVQLSLNVPGKIESVHSADFDEIAWSQNGSELRIVAYSAADIYLSKNSISIDWTVDNGNQISDLRLGEGIKALAVSEDQEIPIRTIDTDHELQLVPNPSFGAVNVSSNEAMVGLEIIGTNGVVISTFDLSSNPSYSHQVVLPSDATLVFVRAIYKDGEQVTKRLLNRR